MYNKISLIKIFKIIILLMVYYYTSKEGHHVYMGYNKTENEELIKYCKYMVKRSITNGCMVSR